MKHVLTISSMIGSLLLIIWVFFYPSGSLKKLSVCNHFSFIVVGCDTTARAAIQTLLEQDRQQRAILWLADNGSPVCDGQHIEQILDGNSLSECLQCTGREDASLCIDRQRSLVSVLPGQKQVLLSDGRHVSYEKLLLACGTIPNEPDVLSTTNVAEASVLGSYQEIRTLAQDLGQHKSNRVVIIGGGMAGCMLANTLCKHNVTVYLIEQENQILKRLIPLHAACMLQQALLQAGVHYCTNTTVNAIESNTSGNISHVVLSDGRHIACDRVITAAGSRLDERFFAHAQITVQGGGVIVDAHMRTNHEDIYLTGMAALVRDRVRGGLHKSSRWVDNSMQGEIAARNMLGLQQQYAGSSFLIDKILFDCRLASCGPVLRTPPSYQVVEKTSECFYQRCSFAHRRLKGFLYLGFFPPSLELLPLIKAIETGAVISTAEALYT